MTNTITVQDGNAGFEEIPDIDAILEKKRKERDSVQ
jgi:hypothetical protein